jgi:hypothetical protein
MKTGRGEGCGRVDWNESTPSITDSFGPPTLECPSSEGRNHIMHIVKAIAVIGFSYSAFIGFYAPRIFYFEGRKGNYTKETAPGWPWRIYQFGFNFIGSVVGWALAISYVQRYRSCPSTFSFSVADAIPLLIGLLGITGLLPRALWGVSDISGELARRLIKVPGPNASKD